RHAVVRLHSTDDLLLLRQPTGIVVVPDELDLSVVRLRARAGEEDLRRRRGHQLLELLCQCDRRLVTAPAEQMSERQTAHLLARRFDQLLVTVAEARAPKASKALDITLAFLVPDEDSFAPLQYQGTGCSMQREIRCRVQDSLNISHGIIGKSHHLACPVLV